ncbi:MAG: hypothetical protein ACOYVD_12445 [Bacillota bacterium]
MDYKRTRKYIIVIFVIMQLYITGLFWTEGNFSLFLGAAGILSIYLTWSYYEQRLGIYYANYIRVLVSTTIILHHFAGEYLGEYKSNPNFDIALHFFGTFSFTLLFYSVINKLAFPKYKEPIIKLIFIFCLGISLGVFFELLEFAIDMVANTDHQPSLKDTNLDLIFDTLGAFFAGIYLTYLQYDNKEHI